MLGPFFRSLIVDPGNILNMLNEHKLVMITSIYITAASITMMFLGAILFSTYGVAISSSFGTILILLTLNYKLYRLKSIINAPYSFHGSALNKSKGSRGMDLSSE